MPADGVDFVDEDDARCVLLALFEHVAHAGSAHAHEHLHEVRARDGEERHIGLAGDGAGQQGLTGAGGTDQQDALGNLAAQTLELLGILKEFDDFLEFLLGFVDARHILEGDTTDLFRQQPRPALAEAHGLAAARLHLAHEEDPDANQQQHREPGDQDIEQRMHVVVRRRDIEGHLMLGQLGDQIGVIARRHR